MTDSHCHIAGEEFIADLDAVVARARQAGVSRALVILAAEDDAEVARAPTETQSQAGREFLDGPALTRSDEPGKAGVVFDAPGVLGKEAA